MAIWTNIYIVVENFLAGGVLRLCAGMGLSWIPGSAHAPGHVPHTMHMTHPHRQLQ